VEDGGGVMLREYKKGRQAGDPRDLVYLPSPFPSARNGREWKARKCFLDAAWGGISC
jgi:hypothetical protein